MVCYICQLYLIETFKTRQSDDSYCQNSWMRSLFLMVTLIFLVPMCNRFYWQVVDTFSSLTGRSLSALLSFWVGILTQNDTGLTNVCQTNVVYFEFCTINAFETKTHSKTRLPSHQGCTAHSLIDTFPHECTFQN